MSEGPTKRRRLPTKKILVAAIGVGAVSYVIACDNTSSSGNLMAPTDSGAVDGAPDVIVSSGNLMAPPPKDATDEDVFVSSGNLMAPPDAGSDAPDGGG